VNATELARQISEPIQTLGLSYYFVPETAALAEARGLNVFQFYGLGRAGVMGEPDEQAVFEAFTFFSPSAINILWTQALEKGEPASTAVAHLEAAWAFADRTFGAVPSAALRGVADAAFAVAASVTPGHHALFDGYARFARPQNVVHAAYQGTILLRELRGGVHIDAIHEVDLPAPAATYLQDQAMFKLHGYKESDVPEVTDELRDKKARAEALTDEKMAAHLEVLSNDQREALAAGCALMVAALAEPVGV
jgi:hypothetical protein